MTRTTIIHDCVQRLRQGESGARERLLACACDRLVALTQKLKREFPRVARWEETDDVLQNSLLRLNRALEQVEIQDARHFLRLAATQIRRELIDLARRYQGPLGMDRHHDTRVKQNDSSDADFSPGPRHSQDETHNPQNLQSWTELHEAINQLSPDLKEVFDLVWYHELPQEEIAEMLGVTTRTVKRRWREARLALHTALQGEPPIGV
jgi:RNA polymerase sigma-70 factor (ECF subfamily)